MFHRGWQPGTATVVDSKVDMDAKMHVSGTWEMVFILDVTPDDGSASFRAEVHERIPVTDPDLMPGDRVAVTYDPKSHKARIDLGWLKQQAQANKNSSDAAWEAKAAAAPDAPPAASSAGGSGAYEGDKELAQVEALEKLADLHTRGALTDQEFEAEKARILES
jgi:hypothetical protein